MTDRKHKHESSNLTKINTEEIGFILEPTKIELGSGYALSVSYDEDENPIIDIKTYGEVDIEKLRKDIARIYPNAQIRQQTQTPTTTIVKKHKPKPRSKKK